MKARYFFICIICMAALTAMIHQAIAADIYQYRDEQGVLRFTDDPSELPESYRIRHGIGVGPLEMEDSSDLPEVIEEEAGEKESTRSLRIQFNDMMEQVKDLYQQLVQERQTLEAVREKMDAKEYNEKVNNYNASMKRYDKLLEDALQVRKQWMNAKEQQQPSTTLPGGAARERAERENMTEEDTGEGFSETTEVDEGFGENDEEGMEMGEEEPIPEG